MKITMNAVRGKAKVYASSAVGIIHACALVSSFITFVCNESATWCSGKFYCAVPVYRSFYVYFSVVALTALMISCVFYILHCTGMYDKLKCSSKRKLLMELSCVSGTVFFFAFGNLFMISRTGNRIVYMVSTFFGCSAMTLFGVQLVLIFLRNYFLLIIESDAEETDGTESHNSKCFTGECRPRKKGIESWKQGQEASYI